jgi:hypothetical protein
LQGNPVTIRIHGRYEKLVDGFFSPPTFLLVRQVHRFKSWCGVLAFLFCLVDVCGLAAPGVAELVLVMHVKSSKRCGRCSRLQDVVWPNFSGTESGEPPSRQTRRHCLPLLLSSSHSSSYTRCFCFAQSMTIPVDLERTSWMVESTSFTTQSPVEQAGRVPFAPSEWGLGRRAETEQVHQPQSRYTISCSIFAARTSWRWTSSAILPESVDDRLYLATHHTPCCAPIQGATEVVLRYPE